MDLVKTLPNEDIDMKYDGKKVKITSTKGKFNFPTYDSSEFFEIPTFEETLA